MPKRALIERTASICTHFHPHLPTIYICSDLAVSRERQDSNLLFIFREPIEHRELQDVEVRVEKEQPQLELRWGRSAISRTNLFLASLMSLTRA